MQESPLCADSCGSNLSSRADSGHIHHRLLARGLTPRKVALLLYGACGLAATLSLVASVAQDQFKGAIIVLFCAAAWMGVQHLGYVEFGTVGRMFMDGAFRRHLNAQLSLQSFEQLVRVASSPEECWILIRERAASSSDVERSALVCQATNLRTATVMENTREPCASIFHFPTATSSNWNTS